MKKRIKDDKNFVDALEGEHAFVVLTKRGRVQILVKPTSKQLRKRGKRGWQLIDTVASNPHAMKNLLRTVGVALESVEANGETVAYSKPKRKATQE